MRKKTILFIILIFIVVTGVIVIKVWPSDVTINIKSLEDKLSHNLTPEQGEVKDLIPFNYDKVHFFEPYQPKESMETQIGFECNILKETVSEAMLNILFVDNNSPVAYLYGYPSNTGYYLDLPVGVYTKTELDAMKYTVTKCEVGNSAGTPQTYLKYLFDK